MESKNFFLSGISSVKKSETYKHETILSNNLMLIEVLEFVRVNNLKDIKFSMAHYCDSKENNIKTMKILHFTH